MGPPKLYPLTRPVRGQSPRPGGQGSDVDVQFPQPKEHIFWGEGRRGGPVAGIIGQSFMCQNYMCFVWFIY